MFSSVGKIELLHEALSAGSFTSVFLFARVLIYMFVSVSQ